MDNIKNIADIGLHPKRSHKVCSHNQIIVHEHSRNLECGHCGKIIEAFDYIFKWANKQQNIRWRNETLEGQVEAKEKELLELNKQIRNIKARLKTAKSKVGEVK